MQKPLTFRDAKPGYAELEVKISAISAKYRPGQSGAQERTFRIEMETACVNAGWTLAEFYTEQDRRH